jgi:hypothetical protein
MAEREEVEETEEVKDVEEEDCGEEVFTTEDTESTEEERGEPREHRLKPMLRPGRRGIPPLRDPARQRTAR